MRGKLDQKVALITGGTSGIGLATAARFVAEGATVFITGRRETELAAAVAGLGADVIGIQGDVSCLADLDRAFAAITQQRGRLDVLFANAGGGSLAPLGTITEEHFDRTFAANVRGLLFTVQKALPLLPPGSSIVLNASTASVKGTPAFSVYSASKAAVRSFARNWAVDLKDRKIRVNAVSPGVVPTPAYDGLGLTKAQVQRIHRRPGGHHPARARRHARRDRQGRSLPRLRRQQLRERHRALRRRRHGSDLRLDVPRAKMCRPLGTNRRTTRSTNSPSAAGTHRRTTMTHRNANSPSRRTARRSRS